MSASHHAQRLVPLAVNIVRAHLLEVIARQAFYAAISKVDFELVFGLFHLHVIFF